MIKQLKSDKPLSLIYLTEVSKKDILSGLDKVSDKYKKITDVIQDKQNIINGFNNVFGNVVTNHNFVIVNTYIFNTLKRLGLSDKEIKNINVAEIIFGEYEGRELENTVQGFIDPNDVNPLSPGEILYGKILQIVDNMKHGKESLHNAYYYYPNGAEFWDWGAVNEAKKDVLAGLDYMSKNPPPPINSKGMGVIIDINTPNEPIMDVFDDLSVPNNAKFLRKNVWVVHENEQNAFIPSDDYFIVFFIDPNDMKKIEHVGIGTDRGDNKLIDEVLDLLNAKFGANF